MKQKTTISSAMQDLIEVVRGSSVWSTTLAEEYGELAAFTMALGMDVLFDDIKETIEILAKAPTGATCYDYEDDLPWDCYSIPEAFGRFYTVDFFRQLLKVIESIRECLITNGELVAHSVAEEMCIFLAVQHAWGVLSLEKVPQSLFKIGCYEQDVIAETPELATDRSEPIGKDEAVDWVFDLFDDSDLLLLYKLKSKDVDGVAYWFEKRFWMDIPSAGQVLEDL